VHNVFSTDLLLILKNKKDKGIKMDISQWLVGNWEYVAIGILLIDKAVALSPMKQDDLIWASVKGAVMKLAGKDK
jgi:hypothetical protein|tara:strand:- start:5678 stop:5902 length:225 start_codon:yes stop_codon:yes gene_type:complete